ncbi:MAG: hypothetical protein ABIJ92_04730 [Candidatus Aenigmatarchaeota archaeon]
MWAPFKKKSATPRSPGRMSSGGSAAGRVMDLSSQGISEPEIIRTLREEGYSPEQVDSGMREALRFSVSSPEAPRPSRFDDRPPSFDRNPEPRDDFRRDFNRGFEEDPDMKQDPPGIEYEKHVPDTLSLPPLPGDEADDFDLPPPPGQRRRMSEDQGMQERLPFRDLEEDQEPDPIHKLEHRKTRRQTERDRMQNLEELTESVVEEKWTDFKTENAEMRKELRHMATRLGILEKILDKIESDKKTEIEEIHDDIDTYKRSITEVGERMGSMEKALKDSMTPMMESLRSLAETIKAMKSEK